MQTVNSFNHHLKNRRVDVTFKAGNVLQQYNSLKFKCDYLPFFSRPVLEHYFGDKIKVFS